MNRLTTDTPRDNMETAMNLFYIKNHETWVRGGGPAPDYPDVSLNEYIREIIKTHSLEIDTSDNEAMVYHLAETLFDGIDTVEGIVATLYTAAWAFSELRGRLKMFEDTGLEPEEVKALLEVPNPPLTLEELREMDGEPVWVEVLVGRFPSHWAIIHGECAHDGRFRDDKNKCLVSFGNSGGYGVAWLAYRRKPEEDQ